MFVVGLGSATPTKRYTQFECWDALSDAPQYHQLSTRAQTLMRKVLHADNGITTRALALESLSDAFNLTPDILHERFLRVAPQLAAEAATKALTQAGLRATEIDGLVISTCTGYLCPGLTSYVGERLGIPPNAIALDLVGHGCAAAAPNLRAAESLLKSGQADRVLAITVEVCSAAFYLDNDPGVLISACLFGDAAGAAVLSLTPQPIYGRTMEWRGARGLISHKDRDLLRFETKGGMLRNLLSRDVPFVVAGHAKQVFEESKTALSFTDADIKHWIVHAGGRDVLLSVQQALNLPAEALQHSASTLNEFGNISSASVFFVLERTLQAEADPGLWWLTTFGAGMCCYGALLRVT